jgi:D-serine deaminase-like pyridoxal phosphate-dependent protein
MMTPVPNDPFTPISPGEVLSSMTDDHFSDLLTDHPLLGRTLDQLPTPLALVDLDQLEANIATMAEFFAPLPATLRPHAKTHRAPAVARRQIAAGATGVTCAKVGMAEAMVDGGIDDVYIANQVVPREAIARLVQLASRSTVTLAVDELGNIADLSEAAAAAGVTLNVVVEIDGGMGRCGVQPGSPALTLAQTVVRAPGLRFAGLHSYEGHLVDNPDFDVRKSATEAMLDLVLETKALIERNGIDVQTITCGGTGTYNISGVYPGVTEHQAGSYVYMDPDYSALVPAFKPALSVLTTVMSRPTPDKVVTDAGMQSLADHYGTPAVQDHSELALVYLSEEHGVWTSESSGLEPGDQVRVFPGHCCATGNMHDAVYAVRNGVVEEVWAVTARGRSQ